MSQTRFLAGTLCAICALGLIPATQTAHGATLLGLDFTTGDMYEISTVDAHMTPIGSTGVPLIGNFAFAPNGKLYGYSAGDAPWLYEIDPTAHTATPRVALTKPGGVLRTFEGGIAFAQDGTAYGVNMSSDAYNYVFKINLTSGELTDIHRLNNGDHDINGMAWYDNGLIGLDGDNDALVKIDPTNGATTVLYDLAAKNGGQSFLGSVGDLVLDGHVAYFSTGSQSSLPGSNGLYSLDLVTGEFHSIGTLSATATTDGISALALVPEPATLSLLALGSVAIIRRRRR